MRSLFRSPAATVWVPPGERRGPLYFQSSKAALSLSDTGGESRESTAYSQETAPPPLPAQDYPGMSGHAETPRPERYRNTAPTGVLVLKPCTNATRKATESGEACPHQAPRTFHSAKSGASMGSNPGGYQGVYLPISYLTKTQRPRRCSTRKYETSEKGISMGIFSPVSRI